MDIIDDAPKSQAALRILLVEDSVQDAELLERELHAQGYTLEMTRVETRAQLDAALDGSTWDILLCHQAWPELDALKTLDAVQSRGLDLPFISIVSSPRAEAMAIEAMWGGAHDLLFKDKLGRLGAVIKRERREAAIRAESRRLQQQLLLADRLTSVGILAAGVAHEINNPLAYVLGNLEFALARLTAMSPGESGELAEIVQALTHAREGSERIRHTTRDLRVFCRTDEETQSAVDVRRVMESSINMAWNEIRHRARLLRRFEPVPNILGNENRLGQVFLNLLVNAAQALPEDRARDNHIAIAIRCDEQHVVIEVEDSGCGISPEQLNRVFEPFFTTKAPGVGSGIGLSICRSIVTDLGGDIQVESRLGEGTTFRILLPAENAALSSHPPRLEALSARRARILVIDDEPALCAVIRRLLGNEHEIHTFVDAHEALRSLRHHNDFDVIFCDLMMPSLSGMDFFAELSRLCPELAGRTVFLTGGAFHGTARQFLSNFPHRVVDKPFEATALRSAIAYVLESHPSSGTWPTCALPDEALRSSG
jgi:signal transduction histidine kinase/ActR/RegA family two-component response regulator